MSRGEPLTDADREPWLEIIRTTAHKTVQAQIGTQLDSGEASDEEDLKSHREPRRLGVIIACSALKHTYRELLRGAKQSEVLPSDLVSPPPHELPTYFLYMKGDKEVLMDRMQKRKGHFMKAKMLESQLNTLESPENEDGVVTVSIEWSTEHQVKEIQEALEERFYEPL
ncbi:hypothetical protein BJ138DRAFT_1152540 [Hygrophoropsis aurantiaca]|uniref:Uncharacterized protein n=1 Tax=Hygrophoropsis aurantiaca TaxID=72124 RepID=A0ACB8ABA3_9AGAM|nr:hypothetical protein BJ138DRAFT_1152540 [Hygrophoropsis aurantiaca]